MQFTHPDFEDNNACTSYAEHCQVNDVIFTPVAEDSTVKWSQSQVAKQLNPPGKWVSSWTDLGWQMKWSLNGMQPQRPIVLVTQDVTLEAGKALLLQ